MTISSSNRKAGPYTGTGAASSFPFSFKVFAASDLYVVKTDVATTIDTVLTLNADYTVTLNADQNTAPGGTVTLTSGALASGYKLTLSSSLDYLQPTDLSNQGGFYPKVITDALDRLTIFVQQIVEKLGRSLSFPISVSGVSAELPVPKANNLLGWNATATSMQNVDATTLATIVAFGTTSADKFNGDGTTTQFALSANPGALNNLDVSIGGVTQRPGLDYTWTSGTTITFTSPPPAGSNNILVRYMQGLPQGSADWYALTNNPIVDVRRFGAACDGVTDDWAAVQAANEWLKAHGGGTLYFPGWCYLETTFYFYGSVANGWIGNPLYPNPYQPMITWASNGQGGIRAGMNSGDLLRFSNPNTSADLFYNVGFRNFAIDCNQKNVTAINGTHYSGIYGANHYIDIDNLVIQAIQGANAIGVDFGTITDSKVKGLSVQGWGSGPYGCVRMNKADVQLIDCHFVYGINNIVIGTISEACIQMFGGSCRSPKIRQIYWESPGADSKASASIISGAFIGESNTTAASTHGPLMGAAAPSTLDVGSVTFIGCQFDNWTISTNLANITWGGSFTFIGNNIWPAATGNQSIKFGQYCNVFWMNNGCTIDATSDALTLGKVNKFKGQLSSETGIGLNGTVPGSAGIAFPATQVAVADPNTLDDYEEGTWTPVLTFATAGDLSVAYGRAVGRYQKIGNTVYVSFTVFASTFTFSTASGELRVTGLPFTVANSPENYLSAAVAFEGYTKANYTVVYAEPVPGASYFTFTAYGSGQTLAGLATADVPSGSRKIIQGQLQYRV